MIAALPAAEPAFVLRQIGTRLQGLELDPYAAGFGQNAIELLLADVTVAAGRAAPIVVRVADTLEEPPTARFDLDHDLDTRDEAPAEGRLQLA